MKLQTNKHNSIFIEKYCPQTLDQIIGNKDKIKQLQKWISSFKKKDTTIKKAVLLSGPSGVGKTLIASLMLKENNFMIYEFNAGDIRSQKAIKDKLEKIIFNSSIYVMTDKISKPAGIIMDELDGMGVGDKGGIQEIMRIINPLRGKRSIKKSDRELMDKRWIHPIICVCNYNYDKKIIDLKKDCLEIKLENIDNSVLLEFAKNIVKKESLNISDSILLEIIKICNSDVRRLIYIIEDLCNFYGKSTIGKDDLVHIRDTFIKKDLDLTLFQSSEILLNNSLSIDDCLYLFDTEKCLLPLMMHENYLSNIKNRNLTEKEKLRVSCKIINNLCYGDMIDKYVYTNQCWDLQDLQGITSCAIPSHYLNSYKNKSTYKTPVVFTSALGKTSLQYNNYKTVEGILFKTGIPNIKIEELILLSKKAVFLVNLQSNVSKKQKIDIINEIKKYRLDADDIDKIIKLNKLNDTLGNIFTTRLKNNLKNMLYIM